MALGADDLRGQREALTEDVDGSGGEEALATDTVKIDVAKNQKKQLKDSALPVVMISVLLVSFGALAATAIYAVSRAFGNEDVPLLTSSLNGSSS